MRYLLLIVGLLGLAGCVSQPVVSALQQCDARQPETTPTGRFRIDEATGTVFDSKTKLTWKRCAEGQSYKAGRCNGEVGEWNWRQAVKEFGVEGSNWRLPNIDEAYSILEKQCVQPAINLTLFPDAWSVWSASPYEFNSNSAWHVNFYISDAEAIALNSRLKVRLVRGEQWVDAHGIAERERNEVRNRELKLEKEKEEARRKITELLEAEKSATFSCSDKLSCDKAFSLTQIYLNQSADMKIQVATDTIVETYNPTEDGKLGLKAIRVPGKGASARIVLTATCKDEKGYFAETCRLVKLRAYQGFRPFIDQMLKG